MNALSNLPEIFHTAANRETNSIWILRLMEQDPQELQNKLDCELKKESSSDDDSDEEQKEKTEQVGE